MQGEALHVSVLNLIFKLNLIVSNTTGPQAQ